MRTLSADALAGLMKLQTEIPFLICLTISHDDLDDDIRLVKNLENISVNGLTYTALDFDLSLPEDKEDGFSRGSIEINNADQWLTPTIRALNGEFWATVQIVTPTDPTADPPEYDNVEQSTVPMLISDIEYSVFSVRANLTADQELADRWPADTFSPYHFPAAFG